VSSPRAPPGAKPAADPPPRPTVNIVGTDGGPSTFNLSTASAFRGCGDGRARDQDRVSCLRELHRVGRPLLDRLGIQLTTSNEQNEEMLETYGIACASVRLPEGSGCSRGRSCRSA
jgi:anthranilate phosphoribosyltransferase